jgi:hypothetical protein
MDARLKQTLHGYNCHELLLCAVNDPENPEKLHQPFSDSRNRIERYPEDLPVMHGD